MRLFLLLFIYALTFSSLSGCKNAKESADTLAAHAKIYEIQFNKAISETNITYAQEILSKFEIEIQETILAAFDDDFCFVKFEGMECVADSDRYSQKTGLGSLLNAAGIHRPMVLKLDVLQRNPILSSFRPLAGIHEQTKNDLIGMLLSQDSLEADIALAALSRSSGHTCRDMQALGNEFAREEAYLRLTSRPSIEWKPNETPIKASFVIQSGEYNIENEHFASTGREARGGSGSNPSYNTVRGLDLRGNTAALNRESISFFNCSVQELRLFNEALNLRGFRGLVTKTIGVEYSIPGLKELIFQPILVVRDSAEQIVENFSTSRYPKIRKDRPFFVVVSLIPTVSGRIRYAQHENRSTIQLSASHIAFYAFDKPVLKLSDLVNARYYEFQSGEVFEPSQLPLIEPTWQFSVE